MRIIVSAETNNGLDSRIGQHFGRCPFFAVVDVEDNKVTEVAIIENPHAAAHRPGQVPQFVHGQGAQVMISGGMGHRAITFFQQFGVTACTGAQNTVGETIDRYLAGQLGSAAPCSTSQEHHSNGDHHHHHHH